MKIDSVTMSDRQEIAVYRYEARVSPPRGIVQIVHGMAEHAGRYAGFACFLVEHGFTVYAADLRGHGKTAGTADNFGYLADTNGFERVVDDQFELNTIITQRHPNVPIILIGHSFGSFVAQRYVQRYGESVQMVVLLGSSGPNSAAKAGRILAGIVSAFGGKKRPSKFLNSMTFGAYNKRFLPAKTPFDWLSRDEDAVRHYVRDPACGFVCTAGFFQDLLYGLDTVHRSAALSGIPKELPIVLFSGDDDPVGGYGKSLQMLVRLYDQAGVKNVRLTLYPGARHELLNETNKQQVMTDILESINQVC